jgi:hypothetical protein
MVFPTSSTCASNYLGVTAGVMGATGGLPVGTASACMGVVGGLDYALTRNLGVGIAATVDYAVPRTMTQTSMFFRADWAQLFGGERGLHGTVVFGRGVEGQRGRGGRHRGGDRENLCGDAPGRQGRRA